MKRQRETLSFKGPKRRDPMARELEKGQYQQKVHRAASDYRRCRSNDRHQLLRAVEEQW
jgi:hypothetical protein